MSAESFKQQLQNHQLLDKNMNRGLATRHHFPLWHQLKRSRFKGIILAFIAIALVLCFFYPRLWRIKWCSSTTLFSKVFVKQNQNLTLVILPKELADEKGAYCLDGGPPSYYIREGKYFLGLCNKTKAVYELAATATATAGSPRHHALKYRRPLATSLATVLAAAIATNSDTAKELKNGAIDLNQGVAILILLHSNSL